jgi:adenylate cyclase class 2
MQYEVENKFPVDDLERIARQLETRGARFGAVTEQVDHYFAHPVRDFALTDEALRIRRSDDQNCVTYKGPKLDRATKTRRELELPLAAGADRTAQYAELLLALGFRSVAVVRKRRRHGRFTWQQWSVEATLDEVNQLGQFLELEIQVSAQSLAAAQSALVALAADLGLGRVERRSYLELLLQSR